MKREATQRRNDPFHMALHWASRSRRRRMAGEHAMTDADLTHLFGGEWGLSPQERGLLLLALMQGKDAAR